MIDFHLFEAVDGICRHVVIDNLVVNAAHQKHVVVSMPLFIALRRIVARAPRLCCFNVADIAHKGLVDGDRVLAPWKGAAVTRLCIEQVVGFLGWPSGTVVG